MLVEYTNGVAGLIPHPESGVPRLEVECCPSLAPLLALGCAVQSFPALLAQYVGSEAASWPVASQSTAKMSARAMYGAVQPCRKDPWYELRQTGGSNNDFAGLPRIDLLLW